MQYRLDCLYEIILRCFDIGFVEESVVTVVREALDCFKLNDNDVMYKAGKVFTGSSGRLRYNISRKQLEFLVQNIKCYRCLIAYKARSENGYGFLKPGLKMGTGNDIFGSETGSGFGHAGGTPPPKIPSSIPPGLHPSCSNHYHLHVFC